MRLVSLGLALVFVVASCKAEDEAQEGPQLPPPESMTLDLSPFTGTASKEGAGPKSNFNNAALRVGVLNLFVRASLLPPAAVLRAALTVRPIFEDGKWIWEFDHSHGGASYAAVLTAWFDNSEREGDSLELAMAITCPTCKIPTTDFTWYTGHFEIGGGRGTWQFFHPGIEQDDQTFVTIDYTVTDLTHRAITATNNRADGHEDAADVIAYALDGDRLQISFHDENEGLDYVAQASLATKAGWLEVPNYNDGEKACWDSELQNVDCE